MSEHDPVRHLQRIRDQLTTFRRQHVEAFLDVSSATKDEKRLLADAVVRAQERIELVDRMIADERSLATGPDASPGPSIRI